jgi:alpha-glucosidase (family GH31 glycosyl hydrolase)
VLRPTLALVIAGSALGCSDEDVATPPVRLVSGEVTVTVTTSPFVLTILDADGRQVLRSSTAASGGVYGGPSATIDTPGFSAQTLPGWDGYFAGEAPWRNATEASIAEKTESGARFALRGPDIEGTLEIGVEGRRVRISFASSTAGLNKTTLGFASGEDEHFFGLGERFASVDHRGLSMYSWAEEGALGRGEDVPAGPENPYPSGPSMTYFPVPFFLSTRGYAVHLDTTYRTELHLASERPDAWRLAVNAAAYDATIYVERDPLASLAAYTEDTGRPPVPAPWVFGPRRRVNRGALVDGVPEFQRMRERDIAITGIDDAVHFLPALSHLGVEDELAAWTAELHAAGYKAHAYNNPYVAQDHENAAADFAYGLEHDYFIRTEDGEIALTQFISGQLLTLATIDLSNPDAFAWFQELLSRALALGYDGWMHDFGEYVPRDAVLFDGRRGDEFHNAFPVLSAKAAHELLEAERPNDYLFFVRSGYSGTQRWVPAVWGGDSEATFDETLGLPSAVRGGLTLSMSGAPYWGSDVTGFKCLTDAPRDKEVFLRWVELGAVSPIMMEQDACANPLGAKEKWKLWNDDETIEHYARWARLHTRLAPYFWALAQEAHASGRPITLHPFLLHPDAPEAIAVDDAFYLGPSLYAAPVVRRGQTVKQTWLPAGQWVDLDDLRVLPGDAIVDIPAPLGKLPLLLAAGGMVPLLDPSIDTLAPATDPTVISLDDVADRLDVLVALEVGQSAAFVLADGTELEASRGSTDAGNAGALAEVDEAELAECASCVHAAPEGDVDRLRANSEATPESELAIADLTLVARGPAARRIRWDVLRLR